MVSTVASGDVKPYVGPSDICMMYSVTDVSGINRISERVLGNAAHALAGMMVYAPRPDRVADTRPAVALTMFGLTTPCVQAITKVLEDELRLPRVPRHRHGRPVDGEAGRVGADRRRARRHHDRGGRRAGGRRADGGPGPHGRHHPRARALCRLVRRARHGEFLGHGHGAGALPRPHALPAQRQRHADAHDRRGVRPDRRASSSTSSTAWRGRCAS